MLQLVRVYNRTKKRVKNKTKKNLLTSCYNRTKGMTLICCQDNTLLGKDGDMVVPQGYLTPPGQVGRGAAPAFPAVLTTGLNHNERISVQGVRGRKKIFFSLAPNNSARRRPRTAIEHARRGRKTIAYG